MSADVLASRHMPLWWDGVAAPPRPPLAEDASCDVAVVGAGITGLTTALLAARAGLSVRVIDMAGVATGTSGYTTAKVTSQHHLTYARLRLTHGDSGARTYAAAMEGAKEQVATLAEGVPCDLQRCPAYVFGTRPGERTLLELETRAAQAAGLPARFDDEVPLPFSTIGGMRLDDQIQFHAVKYLLGLADQVTAAGATIHEQTRALGVKEHDAYAEVRTTRGTLRAAHVVVATLLPFLDRGLHFARAHASRSYVVTAQIAGDLPTAMLQGAGPPAHSVRSVPFGDETLLMALGASHHTGGRADDSRYAAVAEFMARHWEVTTFTHRWSSQDYIPVDGIPYIGRLGHGSERVHVATGLKKWGMTGGTLAGMLITDAITGRDNPWAGLFSAERLSLVSGAPRLAGENGRVALHLVGDRLLDRGSRDLEELAPDEGAIVSFDGDLVAGYRAADSTLHAVSPTCTHLGCHVRWNGAERTWDCPCHGSRFTPDGEILCGPATEPLRRHR